MNKSLLVEVFVPTLGPRRRDGKGEIGEVATGYPVAPDLVLTVRHVFDIDGRDQRYKPSVRIYGDRQSGWHNIIAEFPIDDDVTDAALVQVPPIFRGKTFDIISEALPRSHTRWEGAAFPRAGKVNADRRAVTFSGLVFAMAPEQDQTFDVQVDAAPEAESDWPGASGMPVFCEGKILGLTCSVPNDFRAQRLHVVPSWKLLQNDSFRTRIGHVDRRRRRKDAERQLQDLFRRFPALRKTLKEELDPARFNTATEAAIAKSLLEIGEDDVVPVLAKVHQQLVERAATELVTAVVEMAETLLPALIDGGVVAILGRAMDKATDDLIGLPFHHLTAVELAMAAADGRPARFCRREAEGSYPPGETYIPDAPESGRDTSKSASMIVDHACRKVGLDLTTPRGVADESQLCRLATIEMRNRQNKTGRRYYFARHVPDEIAEEAELRALASALRQRLKPLVCLGLDGGFEADMRDRERYGPFCLMLPKSE